jgi:hypothetical protein
MFSHLPQPFQPGEVIPNGLGEYHYTFRCALGETYHVRTVDYGLASDAELAMRRLCAQHGNVLLAEYLDATKHPASGRNIFSPPTEAAMQARGARVKRVARASSPKV